MVLFIAHTPAASLLQNGLANQCEVVRGNFLEMPFEPNTFDGAYAIEATCHAPKVCLGRRSVFLS